VDHVSFTSRDLRFDSKVGHWKASWSPRHLRSPTTPMLDSRSERGWLPPRESTASRESVWTCRSARAELGKPLRGLPHGPHRVATTTASSFHVFNPDTQTGGRRVFIMTTVHT